MARIPYKKSPGVIAAAALVAMLVHYGVSQDSAQQTAQQTITTVEQFEGYVPEAYQDPGRYLDSLLRRHDKRYPRRQVQRRGVRQVAQRPHR